MNTVIKSCFTVNSEGIQQSYGHSVFINFWKPFITNLLTYSSDVAWGTQRMSWRTLRELSVKLETMTELSEDVVKSEALLPRLALLIYRYDGTPQTPVDTLYTLCP